MKFRLPNCCWWDTNRGGPPWPVSHRPLFAII